MTIKTPDQIYSDALKAGNVKLKDLPFLLEHSLILRKKALRKFIRENIDRDYGKSRKFTDWVRSLDLESMSTVDSLLPELSKCCRKPRRMLEVVMSMSCTVDKLFPNHSEGIRNGFRDMLHVILCRYFGQAIDKGDADGEIDGKDQPCQT